MWRPAKESAILKDIEYCDDILFDNSACQKFWQYIKIKPEKWTEKTTGEPGNGFWMVAILGKSVIYYNDIEEGYNISAFTNHGEIDKYLPGQAKLHEVIDGLFCEMIK